VFVFGRAINWFFDRFNSVTKCARRSLSFLVRIRVIACRLCGAVGADGLALYRRTHRISPNEDQGYFISIIQAPEGLR